MHPLNLVDENFPGVIDLKAILLIWGEVRDETLKKLPIKGYWLYGEYDFIAKVEFPSNPKIKKPNF